MCVREVVLPVLCVWGVPAELCVCVGGFNTTAFQSGRRPYVTGILYVEVI